MNKILVLAMLLLLVSVSVYSKTASKKSDDEDVDPEKKVCFFTCRSNTLLKGVVEESQRTDFCNEQCGWKWSLEGENGDSGV